MWKLLLRERQHVCSELRSWHFQVTYLSLFCIIVIQSYHVLHTALHIQLLEILLCEATLFPVTLLYVKYVLVCSPVPCLSFPCSSVFSTVPLLLSSSSLSFSLFSVSVTVSYINILVNIPLCTCRKTIAFELLSLNFEIEWKITL